MRWMAIVSILVLAPALLEARALPLLVEWEEPAIVTGRGSFMRPGALITTPLTEQSSREANAVLIGEGLAITSAHCVRKDNLRLRRVLVDGKPAHVTATVADLALLEVDRGIAGPYARLRVGDAIVMPRPGAKLRHIWYDHAAGAVDSRVVTWRGRSEVLERFRPGMSGSGLYALTGHLVGIAELANGTVLGPLEIAELLRVREMRNIE